MQLRRWLAGTLVVVILWGGVAAGEEPLSFGRWIQGGHDFQAAPGEDSFVSAWARFMDWMAHGWDNTGAFGGEPGPVPVETVVPVETPVPVVFDGEAFDPFEGGYRFQEFDFGKARVFEDLAGLAGYLVHCHDQMYVQIPLRLAGLGQAELDQVLAYFDWNTFYTYAGGEGEEFRALVTPEYTAGQRILAAYRSGNVFELTERELAALEKARQMVEREDFLGATALEKERMVHDWVCAMCKYWTDDGKHSGEFEDFRNAVGALVDGRGNCMAYADAFTLLMNMAGFRAYTVSGEAVDGEGRFAPHAWNVVEIGGRWYMVDCTYDDLEDGGLACEYIYFNVDQGTMGLTHRWEALLQPVVTALDYAYGYGNLEFPDLLRVADAQALLDCLVEKLQDPAWGKVLVRCDVFSGDLEALFQQLRERGVSVGWKYYQHRLGDALYLCLIVER